MRIFYASDKSPNAAFQSELWRSNLYRSLVDLGHDVVEFDYDLAETFRQPNTHDPKQKAFIAANRPRVTAALLSQVKAAHAAQPIDLLFTYFYDACVLPEAIDAIQALGIKTVNWYCNGSYQLHLVSEISPHYDWCLVPEKFRLADYEAMGARPLYCQEAANPDIYKPFDLPKDFDLAFVGQAYGERPDYIRRLLAAELNPACLGPGLGQVRPAVADPPPPALGWTHTAWHRPTRRSPCRRTCSAGRFPTRSWFECIAGRKSISAFPPAARPIWATTGLSKCACAILRCR